MASFQTTAKKLQASKNRGQAHICIHLSSGSGAICFFSSSPLVMEEGRI
jgi:hypothetical protein